MDEINLNDKDSQENNRELSTENIPRETSYSHTGETSSTSSNPEDNGKVNISTVVDSIDSDSCNNEVVTLSDDLLENGSSVYIDEDGLINVLPLAKKSKDEILEFIESSLQAKISDVLHRNKSYEDELQKFQSRESSHLEKIDVLFKELAQSKADAFVWERELQATSEKLSQEKVSVQADLTDRLEEAVKRCEASYKDKEDMVIKYAMAEKEVLVVKKAKENREKKIKELERDKEILQNKIRSLTTEKSKISFTLDTKVQEYGVSLRTIEKIKEESDAKDVKAKWGHTRMRTEMEAHKETQSKLDRALSKICNHEQEIQSARRDAEKVVKESSEGENARANVLEEQLQETKARLIMESQKYDEMNPVYQQLKIDHEKLRAAHMLLQTEVNTLKAKGKKFEQEREESEKLFESLQTRLKDLKQQNVELNQKLAMSATLEKQLECENDRLKAAQDKARELEDKLDEQTTELDRCRQKEAELLAFTQKLTDKDVMLQSQLSTNLSKVEILEKEQNEKLKKNQDLQIKLSKSLKENQLIEKNRKLEVERLSGNVKDLTEEVNNFETKVGDLQNELQVQLKRHANYLKDSNREVKKLRRKLESCDATATQQPPSVISVSPQFTRRYQPSHEQEQRDGGLGGMSFGNHLPTSIASLGHRLPAWCHSDGLSQDSRTSSDASLNTDSSNTNGVSPNFDHNTPMVAVTDLPQDVLVNRIAKLQNDVSKKREKVEFLEEHVGQLVQELKKKKKIIHFYLMKEESGTLTGPKSDDAKAEILKHGGIMASVYGSCPKDSGMTLELSLEINQKLQAVLEDTLLKNITLKENLNTLGDEVSKLALQNSRSPKF